MTTISEPLRERGPRRNRLVPALGDSLSELSWTECTDGDTPVAQVPGSPKGSEMPKDGV